LGIKVENNQLGNEGMKKIWKGNWKKLRILDLSILVMN